VATAVGALPGIVDGAGAIVPVRDDAALASAIMDFMDDPARIANAGRRGREIIREGFAFDEMVRRFARVYEDVVAEHPRAAA
jgi:glycosyltransferase involved in cell wall biosynthesis